MRKHALTALLATCLLYSCPAARRREMATVPTGLSCPLLVAPMAIGNTAQCRERRSRDADGSSASLCTIDMAQYHMSDRRLGHNIWYSSRVHWCSGVNASVYYYPSDRAVRPCGLPEAIFIRTMFLGSGLRHSMVR